MTDEEILRDVETLQIAAGDNAQLWVENIWDYHEGNLEIIRNKSLIQVAMDGYKLEDAWQDDYENIIQSNGEDLPEWIVIVGDAVIVWDEDQRN